MDDTDIALILNLLEEPNSSNKSLASKLDVSPATITRRRRRLEKDDVLRGKQLLINYDRLGLQLYSIVLIPEEPFTKITLQFQLFFRNHSYTAYQNKIYGKDNGLFVQLNLPPQKDTEELIYEFLDQLLNNNFIKGYELFITADGSKEYGIDTSRYNMQTRQFDIDYSNLRKIMRTSHTSDTIFTRSEPDKSILEHKNLKILRELFLDASRSLREIGEAIGGMSKQEVSRRMKGMEIDDWNFAIWYDREQFGVFNQVLYILNDDKTALPSLDAVLNVFPFHATVYHTTTGIMLWINLPAVDVTRFTDILKERFSLVELYLLGREPMSYPPWEANIVDGDWVMNLEKLSHSYNENMEFLSVEEFFDQLSEMNYDELFNRVY